MEADRKAEGGSGSGEGAAVEVHVYGALTLRFGAESISRPITRKIVLTVGETIADVLDAIGIRPDEVGHLFLNHQYSAAARRVRSGDRLAVFGRDMALLYRQYFPKLTDDP